ncbi:MAG: polysaccharide biosynthesis C-terminal domain-containing protein [Aquincola sp.]|nr:polysaccharide biosynthesis C-terminal domain-containing protein [Aquincola sp.]
MVTRLAGVGLVLSLTALTARIDPETQGAFALFTSVEGVWLALMSGFGLALARRVSHYGEYPRALVAAMVIACMALGVAGGLVLWGMSAFGPPAYSWLWILALSAPLLLLAPNLAGLWLGEGRMVPMARLTVAPPLLALLAVLAASTLVPLSLPVVLGAWAGGKVIVGAAALIALWRGHRLARPDPAALYRELPFIAAIGLTNLIGLLNYRVGLFVIERMLDLSSTGIYSIAIVVAELLWFVSGSLTQAVYGRIGTPDRAHAAATTVRVAQLSVTALLPAAPLLWLTAWLVVPWALGPIYAESLPLLAVLLPGVVLFGGGSALSAYFTNHAGAPRVPAQIAFGSLVINASLALLMAPRLGMMGVALSASLSYAISVLWMAARFASHTRLPLRIVLWPGPQLASDLRTMLALGRAR